ncbi:hypothetical protein BB934_45665 (plasmid) [Microvirga ossetica]|uniref:OmpA-like domain-containing protein n=1 Tax=Microvirga ossetica TaxID=1882682 RepID=A0A1B2EZT9_9HYPH|nr:hypothetical protein [Microvirga ossetica]ANY85510.1 hypothetical protein BB934_45665 [Microvirga ossetica]
MTITAQIERQSNSYRQGLVLGLTQAEIMLLLVFCLLLAAAAVIKRKDDEISKSRIEVAALQGTTTMNRRITELVMRDPAISGQIGPDGSIPEPKLDEYWQEIIENRDIFRQLENHGITKNDLKDDPKFLSEIIELKKEGATAESLKGAMTMLDGMSKAEKALKDALAKRDSELKEALAKGGEMTEALARKDGELKAANARLEEMTKQANAAAGKDEEGHKWPPMISLSEAGGYFFKLGSAELSTEFERRLNEVVVPTLLKTAHEYDVDVIEVVGHTDELPIGVKHSNLDRDMVEVLKGNKPIVALKPGDNAGLGIARSVSVVRSLLQDGRLNGLRVLPLSGAQLVKTDETLANGMDVQGDVKERRRIEIRLRKSAPPEQPKAGSDIANANRG